MKMGSLSKDLYLFDCETILSEIAVIHNPGSNSRSRDQFFVVENRTEWLRLFHNKMRSV